MIRCYSHVFILAAVPCEYALFSLRQLTKLKPDVHHDSTIWVSYILLCIMKKEVGRVYASPPGR